MCFRTYQSVSAPQRTHWTRSTTRPFSSPTPVPPKDSPRASPSMSSAYRRVQNQFYTKKKVKSGRKTRRKSSSQDHVTCTRRSRTASSAIQTVNNEFENENHAGEPRRHYALTPPRCQWTTSKDGGYYHAPINAIRRDDQQSFRDDNREDIHATVENSLKESE